MVSDLVSGAEMLGCLVMAAGLAMTHPKGRRTIYVLARYGKAHMSPWMIAVLAICAFIPGPLDEMVAFPILMLLTLRTRRNRQVLRRYLRRI